MSQEVPKLVMVCGLPGAGKTTLAKEIAKEIPGVRFCPDEWMGELGVSLWDSQFRDKLERRLWKLGQELLSLGQSVILEYGFWGRAEREEKLHEARELGVGVELHYLEVADDELKRRLTNRGMEGDDIIVGKVEEYSNKFERPDEQELAQYDNHEL